MQRWIMKDKTEKFVHKCPSCGVVEERRGAKGAVCTKCCVFMNRVIKSNAFEDTDAVQEA